MMIMTMTFAYELSDLEFDEKMIIHPSAALQSLYVFMDHRRILIRKMVRTVWMSHSFCGYLRACTIQQEFVCTRPYMC